MNKKFNCTCWGTSLRKFSWGTAEENNHAQKLYETTLLEWYDAKHRKASKEEIDYINSFKPEICPYCKNKSFIKYGHTKNNIQIFKCLDCNRKFTILTGTIFDQRKIPFSEWIEYLIHLFEFHSITSSSRDNRNANSTGRYWLFKVFEVLKQYQNNIVLSHHVYIDEMYLPKIKSETKMINGKKLRGLSTNKYCISTGTDGCRCFFLVQGVGKPSSYKALETYGKHIKYGSTLFHDYERTHNLLISKLSLKEIGYKSIGLKNLNDKDNPLDPINNLHSFAKRFMKAHGGYNRDNIDDWMNLIAFIFNPPFNRDAKILEFLEMALKTPKVVRYRKVMSKQYR